MTITLELRLEDAEPILRKAAYDAALYGGRWLHITRRCVNRPGSISDATFDATAAEWQRQYLAAERMVEAFGIEPETTSEGETLTVYVPDIVLKSHVVQMAGMAFRHIDKSKPDANRKNWRPEYRRGVHEEAARQAAERVVRRWRDAIAVAKAA
jgi:hypothetical protein